MSKDQVIALLQEQNAHLREQLADLTAALMDVVRLRGAELDAAEARRAAEPTTGAARQRRYRERHQASLSDVTRDVTSDVTSVTVGGLIGGSTNVPPSSGVTSPPSSPPQVTPLPALPVVPPEVPPAGRSVVPDEDWQAFRVLFPKTDRTSWKEAEAEWRKLNLADRAAALLGARKYDPEPQYRKGAQSWLRARRWETVDDAQPRNGRGVKHMDFSAIDAFGEQLARMGVE